MQKFELFNAIAYSEGEPVKTDLVVDPRFKLVTIGVETGVTIPPCIMKSEMVFFVADGNGSITADAETIKIEPGDIVMVPANTSRSITAEKRLSIMAIQVHSPAGNE